ncbi:hypothetical protein L0U85_04640 [Glycomyces sp. L485]|uniref:hypothetical protein n=1 Tax=Glycomyces sp. L485 TaxID=2909235 RepID=UPI001F4BA651|nr:hypothetical protein [Glycomyces sp. L485]MCH7230152.1 hypothetical protein [Glycomyces sp. L485]
MSELRDSVNALGIADAEAAISVHALVGSDSDLLAQVGDLPGTVKEVAGWVQSTFLNSGNPLFGRCEHAVERLLGERPDEQTEKVLGLITVRPRFLEDLVSLSGLAAADLQTMLEALEQAGVVRADANPLEPDNPFWTMKDRLARFYYAMMAEHLARWRRGYISDKLWRMIHSRFDRYVCRAEYARLTREWALGSPDTDLTTRIVVPDPRFRQLRTLEVAAFGADGTIVGLGTIRWGFLMREKQLARLRHVRRLLGDPPARLYCIAPRVDGAIAADTAPDLYRVGPAHLLRGD